MPDRPRRVFPLRERVIAALLAATALYFVWAGALEHQGWFLGPSGVTPTHFHGESLIHGLPDPNVSYVMPASSVWRALLWNHFSSAGRIAALGALDLLALLLVFNLGRLLHSGLAGLFGVFLTGGLGLFPLVASEETPLYGAMVLLTANLLAWRAAAPDPRRSGLLGLGIGLSLLVRSPLALLPPAILAYEAARRRFPSRRALWLAAASLLLVPGAVLLPWILMNGAVHGRFIPFEEGRLTLNVIAGALGLVSTLWGSNPAPRLGLGEGDSVLWWAAAEVLQHPWRYASAVLLRLRYGLSAHPFLLLAGAAGFWILRARESARQTALLLGYFVLIHCVFVVESRYFLPLWPIAAVLAAVPLAHPLRPPDAGTRDRFTPALAGLGLALAGLLGGISLYWAALYPHRQDERRLDGELARQPRDPWLWAERARRSLSRGDAAAAAGDSAAALRLDPVPAREAAYAGTLLAGGGKAAGLIRHLRARNSGLEVRLLEAVSHLQTGGPEEARRSLAEAAPLLRTAGICGAISYPSDREQRFVDWYCPPSRSLSGLGILGLISDWPAPARARLLERLSSAQGDEPGLLLEAARDAARAGRPDESQRLLGRMTSQGLDSEQLRGAATLASELRDWRRAAIWFREAAARTPKDSGLRLSWAEAAGRSGDRGTAEQALAQALRAGVRPADARWAAGLLIEQGRYRECRDFLAGMAAGTADVELDLLRAAAARGTGEKELAGGALARALTLRPSRGQLRRIAVEYQLLGEYGTAIGLLEPMTTATPADAQALRDKGVCEGLRGSTATAIRDLERAIRAQPGLLSAHLSLGSLYESLGRPEAARRAYREGLAAVPLPEERGLRPLLERSQRRLPAAAPPAPPPAGAPAQDPSQK